MDKGMELNKIVKLSEGESCNYPDIFRDNCGLDLRFPEKKLHAVAPWIIKTNPTNRKAVLEISTFQGISFGAKHYYGKIVIDGVVFVRDGEKGFTTIFDSANPLAKSYYHLILRRPITAREIKEEPERWGNYYEEGDLTNCFNTKEELISHAKQVFKLRFSGVWDFFIDDTRSGITLVSNLD